MMKHDEMIAVITHHKNGGQVQHAGKNYNLRWNDLPEGQKPSWDFSEVNYRAKPEPLVIYAEIMTLDGKFIQFSATEFKATNGRTVKKFVEVME